MKKYNRLVVILLIAVLGLVGIATQAGSPYNIWERPTGDWLSGGYPNTDPAWAWMKWMDGMVRPPGEVFYVDSDNGDDDYDGLTWTRAKATITEGLALVTQDHSTVYVGGTSYTESVTTPGYAKGKLIAVSASKQVPLWQSGAADAHCLLINDGHWEISGFRFHGGNSNTVSLVKCDGEAGASSIYIHDCYFTVGSSTAGGLEFDYTMYDYKIYNNEFFGFTVTGENSGALYGHSYGNSATACEIIGNRFFDCVDCIRLQSSFCTYRDNLFAGRDKDDTTTLNTTTFMDLLNASSANDDGDHTGDGSNLIIGNVFGGVYSWQMDNSHGFQLSDTDIVVGNYFMDGIGGIAGYEAKGADAAQLVPGRTYAMSMLDVSVGDADLFEVDGGPIMITSLTGIITTVISSSACTMTVVLTADTGLDYEFTSAIDIQDWVDGARLIFTSAQPPVMTEVQIGDIKGSSNFMDPWFCDAGMINLTDDEDGATGAISWYMTFIPLIEGVSVTPQ